MGNLRRGSQVVRQRSAKPLFTGSIPVLASKPPSLTLPTEEEGIVNEVVNEVVNEMVSGLVAQFG